MEDRDLEYLDNIIDYCDKVENILNELQGSAEQIRLLGLYSEANLSV